MIETNVTIPAGDTTLAGTLAKPDDGGPFPTALLIAGSGPLDRDGNHNRLRLSLSKDLAKILAGLGWASLRFDKRGVGDSGGDYLSTGFYDELSDGIAAMKWLREQSEASAPIPVGHSAGSLFAAEMSARGLAPDGAVLLAYSLKTGDQTLVWQAGQIGETVPGVVKGIMKLFGTSIQKQQSKAMAKLTATTTDVARIQGQRINVKWMREFISYDPAPTLTATLSPILAVTGSKDVQVDPNDIAMVGNILGARGTTLVVEDVDHILRTETKPMSNPKNYKKQIAKPIDSRVEAELVSWLGERTS